MTFTEYDQKFEQLCLYASKIESIEEEKARRFENRLNGHLYDAVAAQHLSTFAIVI